MDDTDGRLYRTREVLERTLRMEYPVRSGRIDAADRARLGRATSNRSR